MLNIQEWYDIVIQLLSYSYPDSVTTNISLLKLLNIPVDMTIVTDHHGNTTYNTSFEEGNNLFVGFCKTQYENLYCTTRLIAENTQIDINQQFLINHKNTTDQVVDVLRQNLKTFQNQYGVNFYIKSH